VPEGPTPHCFQNSLEQSIVPFDFPRGWCMIRDVIHPLNNMCIGSGVYEVVSEMSPIV